MRIVVTGAVASNGGDAAILVAQRELLLAAFPGATVVFHDRDPEVARTLFPGVEVHPWAWDSLQPRRLPARARRRVATLARRAVARSGAVGRITPSLRSLRAADLVAYTGGTTLIEAYDLRPKLFDLDLAARRRAPVVFLPQSMGPFERPANAAAMRAALGRARSVLLRDERSRRHVAAVGVGGDRVHVVPDVVFALLTDDAVARLAAPADRTGPLRVGVSVRDCARFFPPGTVDGQQAFERAVAELVTHLARAHRAEVTFVSTCQGLPSYPYDDSAVAAAIATRLPADARITVDHAFHGPTELRNLFGGFDLVVSTRLHGAILSLTAGTPVLPIAYEFKTDEVMAQLGLDSFLERITSSGDALCATADRLLGALPAIRPELARRAALLRDRCLATATTLRDDVGAL